MKSSLRYDATGRRRRNGLFATLALTLIVSFVSAARGGHHPTADTLAIVGSRVITTGQFIRQYRDKITRYGLSDNLDTRRGYLQNLVDDEVLIAEARRRGLDRSTESRAELARIEAQELLDTYAESNISSQVRVTDDDLRDLFVKLNTRLKVRHLYAATKGEAESLYKAVMRGESFESLAHSVFRDVRLRESGGLLGYIALDEMDPEFESAAYALRVGDVSLPVKTVQGYSVIRVDDVERNPFLTESEFLKAKGKLTAFARRRKTDRAFVQYTAMLRNRLELRFDDNLAASVFEATRHAWPEIPVESSSLSLTSRELAGTLVRSTSAVWTVADAIDALRTMPDAQRGWIRTKENLEDAVAGLLVRQYILSTAREEGLETMPSYRERVRHEFDSYLLTTLEGHLKGTILLTQDSLRSYYERNKEHFTTEAQTRLSGILVDRPSLADSVRALLDQGVQFDLLARQYSVQQSTAERSGDLGYFTREQLGEFATQMFSLDVGEWSGPFPQDGKSLFVRCTDFRSALQKPFESAAGDIEKILRSMAWRTGRERYVEAFRKRLNYQVHPDRLTALPVH